MQSDIYHSYCRSLLELKNNSKHVIEYLTDLASKSKEHADQIVEAIVQRTFDLLTASNIDSHWPLQSFADFKDADLLKYFPKAEVPERIDMKLLTRTLR
ncbi:hypothetical protein MXB_2016 [Myxobolus squamalis]|nr:hypothetical protein MXB_2016 [Myxobolus squamalis]